MLKYDNSEQLQIVSDALRSIPFPLPYHDWVRIGLALYYHFGERGMEILYQTSCFPFLKYRHETPDRLAARFKDARGHVSLATIFHFARQYGWKYEHPTKIQNEAWHLVAWHDYTDEKGEFAYRLRRYVSPDGKRKRMTIERYENGTKKYDLPPEFRLPYNLPAVRQAIDANELIYFVEGESDADALAANGFVATCIPFGANGWSQRYAGYFKGARICLIPDNDASGKALPLKAIPDLLGVANEVKVIELSGVKDVRELLNTKGVEAFLSLTPIDANEYLTKHKLPEAYPLTRLNGNAPDFIDDGEDEAAENDVMVLFPELSGLISQTFNYIACHDVPKEYALTSSIALISAILGDRVGLQFGDVMIYPNDYFIQIGRSGSGKSTASQIACSLLRKVDERILKIDGKASELLYANAVTARGLIEQIRCESDVERLEREAAERAAQKNKHKFVPPMRTPQTSGLWVIDEFVQLLSSFKREFNSELNALLLSLWDSREMSFRTKSDGRFLVPQTSVVMLANSTPKRFLSALPKHSHSDGFVQRMLIVRASDVRRKTMLEVISAPNIVESDALCERLLDFFVYCSKRPRVKFAPECVEVEKAYLEKYQSRDENIDAFLKRANARMLKFALIVATCKAFETRAREIVIDKQAMLEASNLLDFFIKSTLQFWNESNVEAERPIDAVGKAKTRIITLLREKFNGECKKRTLYQHSHVGKNVFETALNELLETKEVRKEQRPNKNNLPVDWIVIPQKPRATHATHATHATLAEINATETQPKQQNDVKCSVANRSVASDFSSEAVVPEPTNLVEPAPEPTSTTDVALPEPMPTDVVTSDPTPEPTPATNPAAKPGPTAPKRSANPLPKPESLLLANACEIARSLHTEFTAREFINEAMLFHGMTFETAKQMLNALLKEGYVSQGIYRYVRMPKLYPEPQVKSSPTPEPEPESPAEPIGLPFPDAATIDDLASYTMNYLEQTWPRKKIPGEQLRTAIEKIAEKRAKTLWSKIFPDHIVKLHTSDYYILRKHELRPPGYEGLIDDKGCLPDADPAPF